MDVSLGLDARKLIEERLKKGGYATADDLIVAGLASLEREENSGDFVAGELDDLLAEGERSGDPIDGEQVLGEFRDLRTRRVGKVG